MKPVDYVPALDSYYQSQGFPRYRWSVFRTTTWAPFQKRLDEARVALLCSSGISRRDQEPFDPLSRSNLSYRRIPKMTLAQDLVINYAYYDHGDADKDPNIVLPIDRFRELQEEGFIGELAETVYGLGMGRMYQRTALQTQLAPAIAGELKEAKVDVLFCVPD